jgi:quercetin dioxygenase-like cupin family protein
MEISSEPLPSKPGPVDWFTGEVRMDTIAGEDAPLLRAQLLSVSFSPGARTAWHHHPHGQVLQVTEGEGRAQTKGGAVETIRAGDTISFEPGEEHWHGAGPESSMTHLALQERDDDGTPTHWGRHVTDEEYGS